MIDFTLSPEQKQVRDAAKGFAESVLSNAHGLYAKHTSQKARFESMRPIYRQAMAAGLIKGQIPAALGGTAGSFMDAAILVEEFYAVDTSASLTILGTGLGLTPLLLAGSAEQQTRLLKPFLVDEGEPLASLVHSEPGGTANWLEKGGSGLQTTAKRVGNDWIINGEKVGNTWQA
jgi:alkylation response protein AidB-like acyl-CoA dehydrogenase